MMEDPVEPLLEDQLIRKTLLSIQLVSRAGWKAATPFLWDNLKLTCDADYISVFAPITRLLHNLPLTTKGGSRSLAVAMVKEDVECPADVERFFKSTRWIRTIHIRSPPPLKVGEELRLAGHLAKAREGTVLYLGNDIDLYLGGDVLSLLINDSYHSCDSDDEQDTLALLHVVVKDFLPRTITLNDLPVEQDRSRDFWWEGFGGTGRAWTDIPMTIYYPGPGQLRYWAHKSTTIFVGSTGSTRWHGDFNDGGYSSLSVELGIYIANCMLYLDDPHCTTTELNVFVDMADSSGKRGILPLRPGDRDSEIEVAGEDTGGSEDEDEDEATMRLVGAITNLAAQVLEEEGLLEKDDFDRWDYADEIRAAFAAGRLRISSWSGERATEDVVLVE
jgi:hypothetical protein